MWTFVGSHYTSDIMHIHGISFVDAVIFATQHIEMKLENGFVLTARCMFRQHLPSYLSVSTGKKTSKQKKESINHRNQR